MSYFGLDRPSAASSDSPFAIADKAFHDKSVPQAPRMVTPRPRQQQQQSPPAQQQQQAYPMSPQAYSHTPQAYAPPPPHVYASPPPQAPPHPGMRPAATNAYMGATSAPSPPPPSALAVRHPPTTVSPYAIGGYPSHPPPPHPGYAPAPGPSTSAYHPAPSATRPYPVQERPGPGPAPAPTSRPAGVGAHPNHLSPTSTGYSQTRPASSASAHTNSSRSSQIQDDELWQMFSAMDIDRSGTLSAREVQSLLGKDSRWKIEPREDCVKMVSGVWLAGCR